MIVVDTNVVAYLYLPGALTTAAEDLLQHHPQWAAPVLWRSELRNILLGYMRRGELSFEQACAIQEEAELLVEQAEFAVASSTVLRLALDSGCSAYDCEFVALAKGLGTSLATMDAQLLGAFPDVAVPIA